MKNALKSELGGSGQGSPPCSRYHRGEGLKKGVVRMQVCAGARTEEDKNTGAILKCLVGNVDSLSAACARETGRAARNALQVRVDTELLEASWLACFRLVYHCRVCFSDCIEDTPAL